MILPPECRRTIAFSTEYQVSWKCNLLGLASSAVFPSDINPEQCGLLAVREGQPESSSTLRLRVYKSEWHESPLVLRFGQVFLQLGVSPAILRQRLSCLTHETLSNAKAIYKFKVAQKVHNEQVRATLLRALEVDERDLRILLFFMTNLKKTLLSSHRLWEKSITS